MKSTWNLQPKDILMNLWESHQRSTKTNVPETLFRLGFLHPLLRHAWARGCGTPSGNPPSRPINAITGDSYSHQLAAFIFCILFSVDVMLLVMVSTGRCMISIALRRTRRRTKRARTALFKKVVRLVLATCLLRLHVMRQASSSMAFSTRIRYFRRRRRRKARRSTAGLALRNVGLLDWRAKTQRRGGQPLQQL